MLPPYRLPPSSKTNQRKQETPNTNLDDLKKTSNDLKRTSNEPVRNKKKANRKVVQILKLMKNI